MQNGRHSSMYPTTKRKTAKTYETIGIYYVHGMQIKFTTNWVFVLDCDSYIVVACIAKATNAILGRDLKGALCTVLFT